MDFQNKIKQFLQNAGNTVSHFAGGVQQAAQPIEHAIQQAPQQAFSFGQHLLQSAPQAVNRSVPNFVQQVSNTPVSNLNPFNPTAFGMSPNITVGNTIAPFVKNRIIDPAIQATNLLPQRQAFDQTQIMLKNKNNPLLMNQQLSQYNSLPNTLNRAKEGILGAAQTFGNISAPEVTAGFAGYDALKGAAQANRKGQNVTQGALQAFTGQNAPGLGNAVTDNPLIAGALNTGEFVGPLAHGKLGDLKSGAFKLGLKDISANAFNIHPEDQAALKDIVANVQSGIKLSPEQGTDLQRLAQHYLGEKYAFSDTKKIAKTFDYFLAKANGGIPGKLPTANLVGDQGQSIISQIKNQRMATLADSLNGRTSPQADQGFQGLMTGKSEIPAIAPQQMPPQSGKPLGSPEIPQSTPLVSPSLANDTTNIINGATLKEKSLVGRMKTSERYSGDIKQMLDGSYIPKSNAETISAAKKLVRLDPNAAEARAMNPQNAVDQAIGAELFNYHMDNGNVAKANEVLNATSGTNEGQMIQILSQYDKTTPQGAIKFANSAIKSYNETHPLKKISLSQSEMQDLYNMAKNIQSMPMGRERNIAANDLISKVNDKIPSSIADKAITVWKAGLLTSLRTHERNLIGNTIHQGAEILKDTIAAPIDKLLSLKTGKRSLTLNTQGIGSGLKTGLTAAKDIVTKGYDPEETVTKFDQNHVTWGKNKLEQGLKMYTNSVFRTLGAEDKPFLHASMQRSLYDQAKAEAINAGKAGDKAFIDNLVSNPTEQMVKTAESDANTATFHNKNIMSDVANGIKRAAQNPKYGKAAEVGKVVTEGLIPFTGVPSSIAGQMLAYSPIGLVKGIAKAGKVLASSKEIPNLQRQASQEIGRGVMGTGLLGIGAYLTSKGLMTGQPKDPQEAAQWQLENKPANSVLIGGKWRSIGSIGPENLVVLAGAKAEEELQKGKDASVGSYAGNLGKDFLGQTFLQGVQQPLAAINDPVRYGQSYLGNQGSSIVPNIVKDTSKAFDSNARENNNIGDYFTNSLPGIRNNNNIKRDNLGNPIPQEPTGLGAFVDLFNSKTPQSDPVIQELGRLNDAGQNSTPAALNKNQTILGQKVKLDPKELNDLNAASGGIVQQQLNGLITSDLYKGLTDDQKSKAIGDIVSNVRQQYKNTNALQGVDTQPTGNTQQTNTSTSGQTQATPSQGKMTYNINGFDTQGVVTGNKFNYIDPLSGDYKTASVPALKKQEVSNQKSLTDAQYALVTDQAKRANDYQGFVTATQGYIKYLEDYKNGLNPTSDKKTIIETDNKLGDLQAQLSKYKGIGGLKKGKTVRVNFAKTKTQRVKPLSYKSPTAKVKSVKLVSSKSLAYKGKPMKIKRVS